MAMIQKHPHHLPSWSSSFLEHLPLFIHMHSGHHLSFLLSSVYHGADCLTRVRLTILFGCQFLNISNTKIQLFLTLHILSIRSLMIHSMVINIGRNFILTWRILWKHMHWQICLFLKFYIAFLNFFYKTQLILPWLLTIKYKNFLNVILPEIGRDEGERNGGEKKRGKRRRNGRKKNLK